MEVWRGRNWKDNRDACVRRAIYSTLTVKYYTDVPFVRKADGLSGAVCYGPRPKQIYLNERCDDRKMNTSDTSSSRCWCIVNNNVLKNDLRSWVKMGKEVILAGGTRETYLDKKYFVSYQNAETYFFCSQFCELIGTPSILERAVILEILKLCYLMCFMILVSNCWFWSSVCLFFVLRFSWKKRSQSKWDGLIK